MHLISSDNNTGLSSHHQNETMTPTGQLLPIEDLARSMQAMTDHDRQYLISHNTRRKVWHERYNRSYVPLKWDNVLKAEAKVWVEHLLASCGKGMYHDPNAKYGECATANMGTGSFAKLHTTDEIVRRYVEREVNWQPPQNSHLTQVLWRSTKYVGCAEASISMGEGKICHTQVCRYARPGKEILSRYFSFNACNPIIANCFLPHRVLRPCTISRQLQHGEIQERSGQLVDRTDDDG